MAEIIQQKVKFCPLLRPVYFQVRQVKINCGDAGGDFQDVSGLQDARNAAESVHGLVRGQRIGLQQGKGCGPAAWIDVHGQRSRGRVAVGHAQGRHDSRIGSRRGVNRRLRGRRWGEVLAQVLVCHDQPAETKLMVRITEGISGRVGLTPAA